MPQYVVFYSVWNDILQGIRDSITYYYIIQFPYLKQLILMKHGDLYTEYIMLHAWFITLFYSRVFNINIYILSDLHILYIYTFMFNNYYRTKYINNNFKIDVSVFTLIYDINHILFKHIYNIHDLYIITITYLNRYLFKFANNSFSLNK